MAASLLACGVDPKRTLLFRQSSVPQIAQLSWILGSLQTVAQLQRLTQFKEKATKFLQGNVPLGLFTYPVLQAADVLMFKVIRQVSSRVRSLRNPLKKMSKSEASAKSRLEISDSAEEIEEKCRKAVSDTNAQLSYDPQARPAISNLVSFLSNSNDYTLLN
uniref:SNF2_N domain-containing protein n=1 Tax=Angiostrongylus cantonensis TaxID=6313 RepID=A0A0K0D938_ANGCA